MLGWTLDQLRSFVLLLRCLNVRLWNIGKVILRPIFSVVVEPLQFVGLSFGPVEIIFLFLKYLNVTVSFSFKRSVVGPSNILGVLKELVNWLCNVAKWKLQVLVCFLKKQWAVGPLLYVGMSLGPVEIIWLWFFMVFECHSLFLLKAMFGWLVGPVEGTCLVNWLCNVARWNLIQSTACAEDSFLEK